MKKLVAAPIDPSRKMLNVPEAAALLGISASTLNKMRIHGSDLPFLKLGRRVVYDPNDLQQWVDARRRTQVAR